MFKGFASALIALLASPAPAAAPAEIYGRLPAIEQAALSPDGSRIAFIRTTQDWRAPAVFDFITLEQEDHYLSRSATRLQMLQASMAFLEKYNPPD